ncbi:MAG: sigma-70 family RNA polymerase sigma factor [Saprospiraceae bacterium]|nr:sigma-70 family RNA polymerase sigma factor [Saprospiraceae bacterium]
MQATTAEKELLKECLAGKPRAQYELYDRYVGAMYNTAIRMMASAVEAEDVLQEGFTKVFQQLHTFRGESTIGAWIKRIIVTTALTHLRNKKKFQVVELNVVADLEDEEAEEEAPLWDAKTIHYAIQELPEGCRIVFNLFLIEGMQHKEIAEALGITESTSKTQYMRAKKLLRERLKGLRFGGLETR